MGIEGRGGRGSGGPERQAAKASVGGVRRLLIVRRVGIVVAAAMRRMVGEDPFGDPIGVGRGAKNLALVVLQHLDPGLDVARVIGNVAGQPEHGSDGNEVSRLEALLSRKELIQSGHSDRGSTGG